MLTSQILDIVRVLFPVRFELAVMGRVEYPDADGGVEDIEPEWL